LICKTFCEFWEVVSGGSYFLLPPVTPVQQSTSYLKPLLGLWMHTMQDTPVIPPPPPRTPHKLSFAGSISSLVPGLTNPFLTAVRFKPFFEKPFEPPRTPPTTETDNTPNPFWVMPQTLFFPPPKDAPKFTPALARVFLTLSQNLVLFFFFPKPSDPGEV